MEKTKQKDMIPISIRETETEPLSEIQVGDIVLKSNEYDVKELSEIVCTILKKDEVQKYLGILSKQRLSYLGSGIR